MPVRPLPAHLISVSHLTPFARPGDVAAGVPSYVARLLPALRDAGASRQVVVAQREHGTLGVEDGPAGSRVLRAWRGGPRLVSAAGALDIAGTDVCHAQHEVFLYGGIAGALLFPEVVRRVNRRRPVVVTVHGVVDLEDIDEEFVRGNGGKVPPAVVRETLRRVIRNAARRGDATIVHDHLFAQRLEHQYGIASAQVRVIPHPLPERQEIDRDQARHQIGAHGPVVLFFGFVTGYKGLPLLLDAWECYRRAGGEAELVVAGGRHPRMAGSDAYERSYTAMQEQAARIGGVRWPGYLDDDEAVRHVAACDLMVLPYQAALAASGPLSFALAYGRPVIVSDVLAPLAVDPSAVFARDPEALAEAIAAAVEPTRNQALAAASQTAGEDATMERVAQRTVDVYREVRAAR